MNAKLTSQLIQDVEEKLSRNNSYYVTRYMSTYVTSLDIREYHAQQAMELIRELCVRHFKDKGIPFSDITFEKNGILGFWQFTVQTDKEITEYDINEETPEQVTERLLPIAQQWYDRKGYTDYPTEMTITKVEEVAEGIRVTLVGDCGGDVVTLKRNK